MEVRDRTNGAAVVKRFKKNLNVRIMPNSNTKLIALDTSSLSYQELNNGLPCDLRKLNCALNLVYMNETDMQISSSQHFCNTRVVHDVSPLRTDY